MNGHFELSGSTVTTWLQGDVTAGSVTFVHDGGEGAPSYDMQVGDGALSTTPVAAVISFTNLNDVPVLGNNSLTLDEGETVTLTGPVEVVVRNKGSSQTGSWQTEILSMDLSGNVGGVSLELRESAARRCRRKGRGDKETKHSRRPKRRR